MNTTPQKPIINCHTHIFTEKDVPPFLAKSILPTPLYRLVHTGNLAAIVKKYTDVTGAITHQAWYKKLVLLQYQTRMALKRYFVLRLLKILLITYILASIFHDQYKLLKPILIKIPLVSTAAQWLYDWLHRTAFIIITDSWLVKGLVLLVLLLLFPIGKNILWAILRNTNRFVKLLPGKQTTAILARYFNIVRFANYKEQSKVYSRLKLQYPPNTQFVVLPMDMEFMGAGKPARCYYQQMEMLATIKYNHPEEVHPFVFIDPRRMDRDGSTFFDYEIVNNKVVLRDCFVKTYIEDKQFAGFKIYPALGYYPFDERLLPLWKYAADNCIPLMTHCIRGVIYYRDRKKPEWDTHPVFEQSAGKDKTTGEINYRPLLLPQMKTVDVQEIFTHPMNYVCLYEKKLLQQLVATAKDPRVRQLFGYDAETGTIAHGLENLKICFGHFGGEDEWKRFFEQDRSNYAHQVIHNPTRGLEFLTTEHVDPAKRKPSQGKPEQLWKYADWYSIICSLMLQYPNVYGDISYILHGDLDILPLLRHTLQHTVLKERVLYGTDFFVVRNHKSDKNMLADIKGGLLKDEFDQIARENPVNYLTNCLPRTAAPVISQPAPQTLQL